MLINEYINQRYQTNFSSDLNGFAIKLSMGSALCADQGCLIGQCNPDLWKFFSKMNETGNFEMNDNNYINHNSNDYYFRTHLIQGYELAQNMLDFNSKDEIIHVISCNLQDNEFFVGCSLTKFIKEISKCFSEQKLCIELFKLAKSDCLRSFNETNHLVDKYFELKNSGIHEVYFCVSRSLRKMHLAPNPVYPFHHMWNGYTPWRQFDDCIIKDLYQIKFMPMIYNGKKIIENEEKHTAKIKIVKGNIVDFFTDAIVNAANEQLVAGGGVCGAIFAAAGYEKLTKACNKIGYCKTGEAVITDGFELEAGYIIHAVGPVYRDDSSAKYLRKTYINTLNLADDYCCKSIAVPSISTGIYGYPKDKAVKIALDVMINFHSAVLKEINVVCFDDETFDLYTKELKRQERLNKVKGCLLGGAVGDALGYPVEFNSYEQIQNKYGVNGIQEYELSNGKAIISDDTQMTLFTAVGLLWWDARWKSKGVSPSSTECVYWAYLDWLETQNVNAPKHHEVSWIKNKEQLNHRRAPGNTCLSALMSGKMGTEEDRINTSKGCGGVMRVAPIGLFYKTAIPHEFSLVAAEVAAITHGHDLALIPSVMLVSIIQSIMNSVYMESHNVSLRRHIKEALDGVVWHYKNSKHIGYFETLLNKAIELSSQNNKPIDDIKQLGEGWVAEEALAIAVYSVLKATSFEEAIIIAVNHDGDSDSTGAIAGNIAGAFYGYNKIPLKFKENLELKNTMKEISEDLCDVHYKSFEDMKNDFKYIKKYVPYY